MENPTGTHLILSNWSYDTGKRVVQVILPAISSLYFGLGQIWGFPAIENVVGSIAVITTFLGVILGVSTKNYRDTVETNAGTLFVGPTSTGKKRFSLDVTGDLDRLEQFGVISFKVEHKEFED